jgi:hypothetical protein
MGREGDLRDYNVERLHYWGVGLRMQWSAHNCDFLIYILCNADLNMFLARPFPPQLLYFKITSKLIKTIYRTSEIDS